MHFVPGSHDGSDSYCHFETGGTHRSSACSGGACSRDATSKHSCCPPLIQALTHSPTFDYSHIGSRYWTYSTLQVGLGNREYAMAYSDRVQAFAPWTNVLHCTIKLAMSQSEPTIPFILSICRGMAVITRVQ